MIPHNMTLFKFMCVQYQFHGQTLPIMKIDQGQIQFREYVSTGTEPEPGRPGCVISIEKGVKPAHATSTEKRLVRKLSFPLYTSHHRGLKPYNK